MKREDIQKMARDIIESGAVESDYIEYKKSASGRDTILKTACAFCNNYMNREIAGSVPFQSDACSYPRQASRSWIVPCVCR